MNKLPTLAPDWTKVDVTEYTWQVGIRQPKPSMSRLTIAQMIIAATLTALVTVQLAILVGII